MPVAGAGFDAAVAEELWLADCDAHLAVRPDFTLRKRPPGGGPPGGEQNQWELSGQNINS
jgi:hypothetical protein